MKTLAERMATGVQAEFPKVVKIDQKEPRHVVVRARAGTGKTTTIVEGLKAMRGIPTSITPSPQQQAIWDELALSQNARYVCFCAFNKSIAAELKTRVPESVDAKTLHGLGCGSIYRSMKGMNFGEPNPERSAMLMAKLLKVDYYNLKNENYALTSGIVELVSLCKVNLFEGKYDDLDYLCSRHDIDFKPRAGSSYTEDQNRRLAFELAPEVLKLSRTSHLDGQIDYDDMIWLPVVLGLNVFRYDLLLVDECQDLNRCQQALAKLAGRRLVLVGDDRQAIYGFAGADSESFDRMVRECSATERGCVELPLTVTRRCGKAIVNEARQIVPDFDAHESNPKGKILEAKFPSQKDERNKAFELSNEETYLPMVEDGDMVICRTNAPLVSQYFKFLSMGKRSYIQGRKDVGDKLTALIKRFGCETVSELITEVGRWADKKKEKELARTNPREMTLQNIEDRRDCILHFCDKFNQISEITDRINLIFSDSSARGIRLSSIHKAKGLEAKRVFFLIPDVYGGWYVKKNAKDWERKQMKNLMYVGITRAIDTLVYVS